VTCCCSILSPGIVEQYLDLQPSASERDLNYKKNDVKVNNVNFALE
jgi:hypothetical protein